MALKTTAVSETTFFLDRASRTGLQSQIREIIVSAVLSGQALPGAKLPSTRKLANYLNISRLTVTIAYQELAFQGYLEVKDRSAYHISMMPPINMIGHAHDLQSCDAVDWENKIRPGLLIAKSIRKPLDWRSYKYPFLYGQMDHSLFDLAGWRDCSRRPCHARILH
ncbi:GntR family transcriptional regulator [Paenochrobactrum sp. BZR 588]|uniref:GntR family transcriptional regulator n=1 Tax=unclassified Paenochrobactrum TaxID=2639760 RepID=UPI003853729C